MTLIIKSNYYKRLLTCGYICDFKHYLMKLYSKSRSSLYFKLFDLFHLVFVLFSFCFIFNKIKRERKKRK